MIIGVQLLGVLFGLMMLYVTFIQHKRRELTFNEWGFWSLLSCVFIVFSLAPGLLDPLVESLEFGRTMDLFTIMGFMFLVGSLFYTYTIVRTDQKRFEELVRALAIRRVKREKP
ncbi:hypothetical protein COT48_05575 [Candidatus Woesearchaeota archaeon CG08_land_8_20_14_0_20_47_9]|nr:MAG: hypothetical protein COT48_05575 [Candidatus Woesearchaeota archaeon CG08_land_8_20_14_0_20_47_9]